MNQICSLCNRQKTKVLKVKDICCLCEDCLNACYKIFNHSQTVISDQNPKKLTTATMVPEEITAFLNDYVIGQNEAKKTLSVAVRNHYKRINCQTEVELEKSNILIIGPTGSGKTFLVETLAKILNVPFATSDATTLTEAGYVGEDVEIVIQKLLSSCNNDVSKAERGIIYIDEIDKISAKGDRATVRDISGRGVQHGLLKLLDGTIANVPLEGVHKSSNNKYAKVNTKNILFICGGAFEGLGKIIQERTNKQSIGFNANIYSEKDKKPISKILEQVTREDLLKYGLIPEFAGRLPVITIVDELQEDDLIRILTEPKNAPAKQYQELFRIDGTILEFSQEALQAIARRAIIEKSGARGLRAILDGVLKDTMYQLSSAKWSKVVIEQKDDRIVAVPQSAKTDKQEHQIN